MGAKKKASRAATKVRMTAKTYGSGWPLEHVHEERVQRLSGEGSSCSVNNAVSGKVKSPQLKLSENRRSARGDAEPVAQSTQLARKFSSVDCESEHLGHRLGIARRCRERSSTRAPGFRSSPRARFGAPLRSSSGDPDRKCHTPLYCPLHREHIDGWRTGQKESDRSATETARCS